VSDREEILRKLRSLVSFDLRSLFDTNNAVLPVAEWPDEASLVVTNISSRELFDGAGPDRVLIGVEHKVRLSDRIRAVELAMKQQGLFAEPPADPADDHRPVDQLTDAELADRIARHPPSFAGELTPAMIDARFEANDTAYRTARANVGGEPLPSRQEMADALAAALMALDAVVRHARPADRSSDRPAAALPAPEPEILPPRRPAAFSPSLLRPFHTSSPYGGY
jgi:hypothetical protein